MKDSRFGIEITEYTDIGHGITIKPLVQDDDKVVGFTVRHFHPDGEECVGSVLLAEFKPVHPHWTVEQERPLTLQPSILSQPCNLHGWIRNGQWVPA